MKWRWGRRAGREAFRGIHAATQALTLQRWHLCNFLHQFVLGAFFPCALPPYILSKFKQCLCSNTQIYKIGGFLCRVIFFPTRKTNYWHFRDTSGSCFWLWVHWYNDVYMEKSYFRSCLRPQGTGPWHSTLADGVQLLLCSTLTWHGEQMCDPGLKNEHASIKTHSYF